MNGKRGIYWPPLHNTVVNNDLPMAEYLLERGIDKDEKDQTGQTALELARQKGRKEMAAFLDAQKSPEDI